MWLMYYLPTLSKTSRTASEFRNLDRSLVIYPRGNRLNDGSSLREGHARRLIIIQLQAQAAKWQHRSSRPEWARGGYAVGQVPRPALLRLS